ncbi:MAG: carboxymuconolactone decarboxylase family protein [Ramlibacter sp.]
MARLPPVDIERLPEDLAALIKSRPPLNLFKVLPHSIPTARGFMALGSAILRQGTLDPQLRELVILRVGALSGATYEMHQHKRIAATVGVGADRIAAAVLERDESCLGAFEADVMRFVDAVVHRVKAPRWLYDKVAAQLDAAQICELLHTIGFYMLVSRFLENLEVDIEAAEGASHG